MVKITLEDNSINIVSGGAFMALSIKSDLLFDSLVLNDLLLELG